MKFTVLLETASLNETELAAYCRNKGLYVKDLTSWKAEAIHGYSRQNIADAGLKKDLQLMTKEASKLKKELDAFAEKWDDKFPTISQIWSKHLDNLITLFDYPDDIRKVFPTDKSAMKVVYLVIESASKKWTVPIHHWKAALNRFMIEFPVRMTAKF